MGLRWAGGKHHNAEGDGGSNGHRRYCKRCEGGLSKRPPQGQRARMRKLPMGPKTPFLRPPKIPFFLKIITRISGYLVHDERPHLHVGYLTRSRSLLPTPPANMRRPDMTRSYKKHAKLPEEIIQGNLPPLCTNTSCLRSPPLSSPHLILVILHLYRDEGRSRHFRN